jgi:hypothetical protein
MRKGEKIIAYRYTVEQKAQALILLAANRGDVPLTSSQTGIAPNMLNNWAKNEKTLPSPDIGKGMEQAIHYLMGQIPNLVNKYNVAELLGTLLEKWLQYKGVPQNSTQTILAVLATKSESQLDAMIGDIEQGRRLTLNDQDQVLTVEKELESMGLSGLAERGVNPELVGQPINANSPTEVVDLIQYQVEDDTRELEGDGNEDW